MNILFKGDIIFSQGIKMQVCEILDAGTRTQKAHITACKFNGSKPLKNRAQYIGAEWELT